MGYIVKDYTQDAEYKLRVNIFISDSKGNTLIQIKNEASVFKDINSFNIATNFTKGSTSKTKYELLELVLTYMEDYEQEIHQDFKESIEDYESRD